MALFASKSRRHMLTTPFAAVALLAVVCYGARKLLDRLRSKPNKFTDSFPAASQSPRHDTTGDVSKVTSVGSELKDADTAVEKTDSSDSTPDSSSDESSTDDSSAVSPPSTPSSLSSSTPPDSFPTLSRQLQSVYFNINPRADPERDHREWLISRIRELPESLLSYATVFDDDDSDSDEEDWDSDYFGLTLRGSVLMQQAVRKLMARNYRLPSKQDEDLLLRQLLGQGAWLDAAEWLHLEESFIDDEAVYNSAEMIVWALQTITGAIGYYYNQSDAREWCQTLWAHVFVEARQEFDVDWTPAPKALRSKLRLRRQKRELEPEFLALTHAPVFSEYLHSGQRTFREFLEMKRTEDASGGTNQHDKQRDVESHDHEDTAREDSQLGAEFQMQGEYEEQDEDEDEEEGLTAEELAEGEAFRGMAYFGPPSGRHQLPPAQSWHWPSGLQSQPAFEPMSSPFIPMSLPRTASGVLSSACRLENTASCGKTADAGESMVQVTA